MRTTIARLEALVEHLNKITKSPLTYSTMNEDTNTYVINVGHYHISGAYGGVELQRTMNNGGGVEVISRDGHDTKKKLDAFLTAYISGIEFNND